jgi:hypothetical protein
MNELIEQIKRDAVTIQKFTEAELQTRQILKAALGPAYKEGETAHDAIDRIMTRNAQTEARMFNDAAKRLDAASTRIHELEQHLQTAEKRMAELLCEPDEAVRTLRDLESTANDNGRKPDEAVREFLTRTVSELMTAEGKVRRIQKHAIACNANPEESVIDFMTRMKNWNEAQTQQLAEADSAADKNGCGRTEETAHFINRLAAELKNAKYAIAEKDSEIGKLISLSNERAQEIGKLKATHVQDLSRIEKLSALKGLIEGTAKDHGISESDALKWLVNDICGDNKRQRATVTRLQKVLSKIHAAAKAAGLKQGESIDAYIVRAAADAMNQRHAMMHLQDLARSYDAKQSESVSDFVTRQKNTIDKLTSTRSVLAEEELKTARAESLRARTEASTLKTQLDQQQERARLAEHQLRAGQVSWNTYAQLATFATSLGMTKDESVKQFIERMSDLVIKEQRQADEARRQTDMVRQELGDKTQKVLELSRWHEENLEKIKGLEADLAHSRSQESPEATRNALRNVTADRDRIRTELAAILAEANKSGRCNGDPVQLLKQGQADLDALIRLETDKANLLGRMDNLETQLKAANAAALSAEEHAERATFSENESAKLNALVSKLQGELATARDQAGVAQHECSIWNNAATRAGQTLTKLGKLQDENEAQFIERMQGAEFNREEQLKNALAAKNKAQSEDDESHRRFMNLIRMADSCGRLRGESVEQFVARQDQLRVSNMEQRDEARSEVERLSALVASLQVELDDANRKYGDIMAALGNETPLQLIERMQRLAQDQRASTIPHDERAMLVAESADLRKRLEASQKAHAKTEHELGGKLRAALATVANQSAAIAEAQRVTEKYTSACKAATKLKDWASTVRHKVMVKVVHDKAMQEYDNIIKELDGEAVANGS